MSREVQSTGRHMLPHAWDGEIQLGLGSSLHPGWGRLDPFPIPAVARVSPASLAPSASATQGGSALSPCSLQHCACRQGPAAAPTHDRR